MVHVLTIVFVTLSWSCGPHIVVAPTDVQAAKELYAECGDVLTVAPGGVTVTEAADMLDGHNHAWKSCAAGMQVGDAIYVLPIGAWTPCYSGDKWMSDIALAPKGQKLVIAHELGHAGGLVDTTTGGLMTHFDKTCLHRECACLREALHR